MDEREAFQLLTLASVRDGRPVTQAHARVWADDLARVDYFDAVEAVKTHYQRTRDWVMPSDVIQGARRVRETRERQARINQPAIEKQPITLDKALYDQQVAWFTEHPGATIDDYEKAMKQ